jgi:hypothetical protein
MTLEVHCQFVFLDSSVSLGYVVLPVVVADMMAVCVVLEQR